MSACAASKVMAKTLRNNLSCCASVLMTLTARRQEWGCRDSIHLNSLQHQPQITEWRDDEERETLESFFVCIAPSVQVVTLDPI